jgi:hypothetical protein
MKKMNLVSISVSANVKIGNENVKIGKGGGGA